MINLYHFTPFYGFDNVPLTVLQLFLREKNISLLAIIICVQFLYLLDDILNEYK